MSSEGLKSDPVLFNYLDSEKRFQELTFTLLILEKSVSESAMKAYHFHHDRLFTEEHLTDPSFNYKDMSLNYLGIVDYLDKSQKKALLVQGTVIRYSQLIVVSSKKGDVATFHQDLNLALGSLIDAIRVSRKVDVDKMISPLEVTPHSMGPKISTDDPVSSLRSMIPQPDNSATSFTRRHFELDV